MYPPRAVTIPERYTMMKCDRRYQMMYRGLTDLASMAAAHPYWRGECRSESREAPVSSPISVAASRGDPASIVYHTPLFHGKMVERGQEGK